MRATIRNLATTGLAAALCGLLLMGFSAPASVQAFVGFTHDVTGADLDLLRLHGATDLVVISSIDTVAVTAALADLEQIAGQPGVLGVRPEGHIELALSQSVRYVRADRAMVETTFEVDRVEYVRPGVAGSGVTVAVLDSGISPHHPDLADRVIDRYDFELSYAINGRSDSADDDLLDESTRDDLAHAMGQALVDEVGHGTHVAGILAGTGQAWTPSPGMPTAHGVAPAADLVDVRINSRATFGAETDVMFERNAVVALDWLLRHHDDPRFGPNGIQVVNNSWVITEHELPAFGAASYDPVRSVTERLADDGVILVFSAGNDGGNDQTPTITTAPAGTRSVITVAGTCLPLNATYDNGCDQPGHEGIMDMSSRGVAADAPDADDNSVDVAAPGNAVLSALSPAAAQYNATATTYWAGSNALSDYHPYGTTLEAQVANARWYKVGTGTSMAAPHVTGAVALMLQIDPTLTVDNAREILTATAQPFEGVSFQAQGHGLIDVEAALRLTVARTGCQPPPGPPQSRPGEPPARGRSDCPGAARPLPGHPSVS